MVLPLIPLFLGAAALGLSGFSLYTQHNQRQVYKQENEVTNEFKQGYSDYLSRQGRKLNPARSWKAYDSSIAHNNMNMLNSQLQSFNTAQNMGKQMYSLYNTGHHSRWL